jgi:soluble lytic murein transglycosylase
MTAAFELKSIRQARVKPDTHAGAAPSLIFAVLLAFLVAGTLAFWVFNEDPIYTLHEQVPGSKFRTFDPLILSAAKRHDVDPALVKSVIWQESRFRPDATGTAGERGLMQVTEIASQDWVTANQIKNFTPTDLFDPATNLEVGVWFLGRALRRHADKDDPRPFALAEFNAGASRVNRWMTAQNADGEQGADSFRGRIDFPLTASYISSILGRHQFYLDRGEFTEL